MRENRKKRPRKTEGSPTHQSAMVSPESRQANQVSQGERFRLLVQGVTDYAIFLLDTEGQVTCWNTGAKFLFGYPETEIIGQHYSRLFTPEDIQSDEPEKDLKASIARVGAQAVRWHVRADGTRFWCHGTITAIRDSDGTLLGFAKVVRDLTGQHWHERIRNAYCPNGGIPAAVSMNEGV
jgi:PAS domain S-box-containing protein